MDKKYEIALSYANGNKELSDWISDELYSMFDKAFFKDRLHPEELALAESFIPKLEGFFSNTHFSVILYSEEYKNGQFALYELKQIIKEAEKNKECNFFIIKADNTPIEEKLQEAYYLDLNPRHFYPEEKMKKRIEEIVHKNIKPQMIKRTIQNKKEENKYTLNIHTVYTNGNYAKWLDNYDWNILAKKYIDGREIKEPYTWEDLWNRICSDFNLIREGLQKESNDTTMAIHFNCHLSIAYKLGQIYGNLDQPSANRNLHLLSSNGRIKFVFQKEQSLKEVPDFCKSYSGNDMMGKDIVCIVSIKKPKNKHILEDVKAFLDHEDQKYCSLLLFQDERYINSTEELESLANYIFEEMASSRISGRNCTFHLFLDTLAPLAFVLGGKRPFSGEVQLYEYVENLATYKKSLTRGIG